MDVVSTGLFEAQSISDAGARRKLVSCIRELAIRMAALEEENRALREDVAGNTHIPTAPIEYNPPA